ncbi:type III PLP-dependent enzyme [Streptomyces sp. BP-8]|uniref:Type III PLP-dependent enzyme n=1 Tax=Streptomyces sirii TaxID=3127701 RepID=A0ABZ2QWQ0_9ACTN
MADTSATVQGLAVTDLAEEFGTPFFLYDADRLERDYREVRRLLHPGADLFFSLKANPNVSVCAVLGALGSGAEVSSLAELRTALWAGIAPQDVIFLGPGKTPREIEACVRTDLRAVVCESPAELRRLERAARDAGRTDVPVLLRINPDFTTKGSGLSMGGKPRQFGMDAGLLREQRHRLHELRHLRIRGFHAYMGTRFLRHEDIVHNTREILRLATELAAELDLPCELVDIGGGFGVAYFDNETDLDLPALAAGVDDVVGDFLQAHPGSRVICELGRYLTARCGTYVSRVLDVKESMGTRFAVTDGGTHHHMAAVGVGSFVKRNFPMRALTRPAGGEQPYTVTGPLCTPNDVLGKNVLLPPLEPGDLIGVERSGAYGPSASPGLFLSHGFPAEVMVRAGRAHLVRVRDTVEDLLSRQRLIPM